MGSIYKITNTVNGKSYIGKTTRDAEKTRIRAHLRGRGSQPVKDAIEKYGQDAFTYEILHDGIIPEFLDNLEKEVIAKFNTVSPHGYNLTEGGDTNPMDMPEVRQKHSEAMKRPEVRQKHSEAMRHPEVRQKLSKASTGKRHTDETRRNMSETRKGENNPMYGKPCSDDTKRKISEANTGRKHSDEARQNMSEARKGEKHPMYGRKHSDEAKQKMSESHKRPEVRQKHSEATKGENNPMYGKRHSDEAKQKMSESRKGKSRSAETKRKISEAQRIPEYNLAREFFLSLPTDMALAEKRRLLYQKFISVHRATIRRWTAKWTKDS